MSGVVKAVKKVFSKVVSFVKKALPYIIMAAAVYFTAGVALSAFPATSAFAASMPGFAGGGFAGLGIGAGSTAGTGLFSHAASAMGLGTLGSSGGLVGGAMSAGTTAAQLAGAGISQAAIATGATEGVASGLLASPTAAASTAGIGGAAAAGAAPATGAAAAGTQAAGAAAGAAAPAATAAKAGMSIGEKLLLASSGTQAVGALLAPGAQSGKNFHGSYYGIDRKGKGPGGFVPPAEEPAAPAAPSGQQAPAPAEAMKVEDAQPSGEAPQKPNELFAQGSQLQTAAQPRSGSRFENQNQDLFRQMPGVRYVA